jgi:hypothetical protein
MVNVKKNGSAYGDVVAIAPRTLEVMVQMVERRRTIERVR